MRLRSEMMLNAGRAILASLSASLVLVASAQAALIGNDLTPRDTPSDGAEGVFYTNFVQMPTDGVVPSASIFFQGDLQTFKVFQLRPTGVADQFRVVYDSGLITPSGTSGEVASLPFPNGPTDALAGDIFAHYGRGIPFSSAGGLNANNALPIFWVVPEASIPAPGAPDALTISTTGGSSPLGDFPFQAGLVRDYALAVNLITGDLVPGDVDGNGDVDLDDFAIIRDHFLTGTTLEEGDLNFDGTVDFEDFLAWKTEFGGGGPNSVPEPATLPLMALGAAIVALRWRRPR